MIIQIDGTIVAPDEPMNWDPKLPRLWLDFSRLNGVLFQGNGVIDGSGSKWWESSCKKNKSNVIYLDYSVALSVLEYFKSTNKTLMHVSLSSFLYSLAEEHQL